jgi:hypothetical protein
MSISAKQVDAAERILKIILDVTPNERINARQIMYLASGIGKLLAIHTVDQTSIADAILSRVFLSPVLKDKDAS